MPRRLLRFRALMMALIIGLTCIGIAWALTARSLYNENTNRFQQNEIASIKALQAQELATFNLLRDTVTRFTGPAAQKAQAEATKAFIDSLIKRIEQENAALLSAIQGGSSVIVTPGPTKTVTKTVTICRTPSGKSC